MNFVYIAYWFNLCYFRYIVIDDRNDKLPMVFKNTFQLKESFHVYSTAEFNSIRSYYTSSYNICFWDKIKANGFLMLINIYLFFFIAFISRLFLYISKSNMKTFYLYYIYKLANYLYNKNHVTVCSHTRELPYIYYKIVIAYQPH